MDIVDVQPPLEGVQTAGNCVSPVNEVFVQFDVVRGLVCNGAIAEDLSLAVQAGEDGDKGFMR